MSTEFATAFRETLVKTADAPEMRRPRRRPWVIGGSIALGAVLVSGATAVALFTPPGEPVITELAPPVSGEFTGTGTIELGDPPTGATGITVSFSCVTAGTFVSDEWGGVTCETPAAGGMSSRNVLAIPASHSVTVRATDDATWLISVVYVRSTPAAWGVNDGGSTFGVPRGTPGGPVLESDSPDLIPVVATNGRAGYVWKDDEAWATGDEAMSTFTSPDDALRWQETEGRLDHVIPVYESDGETIIGEFLVQGADSLNGTSYQPPVTRPPSPRG